MKINLYFFFIVFFLSSCNEYEKNLFLIDNVSFRVFDLVGIDSNNCAMIENYSCDRDNYYSGIGIQLYKKYYSDSSRLRNIGAGSRGIDGINQKIMSIAIKVYSPKDILDITSEFRGIDSLNSLNEKFVKRVGVHHMTYKTITNCISSTYFSSIDSMKILINNNDKSIRYEEPLFHEVLFWIPKKDLNRLVKNGYKELMFEIKIENNIYKNQVSIDGCGSVVN